MDMAISRPVRISKRQHDSVITGSSLPLSMVPEGRTVRVQRVRGKESFVRHLANLGFVEGSKIRVVIKATGNAIVNVKGTQVGLDRDTAKRIITA